MFSDSIKNAKNVARKVIKVGNIHVTYHFTIVLAGCVKNQSHFYYKSG